MPFRDILDLGPVGVCAFGLQPSGMKELFFVNFERADHILKPVSVN
jgi:hypothetical protein